MELLATRVARERPRTVCLQVSDPASTWDFGSRAAASQWCQCQGGDGNRKAVQWLGHNGQQRPALLEIKYALRIGLVNSPFLRCPFNKKADAWLGTQSLAHEDFNMLVTVFQSGT